MRPVYVAGPVTGLPRDNRPAFEGAAGALRDAGYCPVVPHAHIPAGTPWRDAMRRSLGLVMACDGVALIDGWEASRGARLEVEVARALDIPAMPLREWTAGEGREMTERGRAARRRGKTMKGIEMETININGKERVPAEGEHVCVICERGWIFEGRRAGGGWTLVGASVVRRWENGLGIGGLAQAEHKDDYTLDPVGTITISERAVIASIPLEW